MRGILLDPKTGRPQDEFSIVDQNAALAAAAERDGRFRRVIRFLEQGQELGEDGPKMVGGVAWRDYVPGCEYMVAAPTAITGTAEALLWPAPYTFIPAGFLQPGKMLHLSAWGRMTTAGSTPGNLTLTGRYGTTTGGTSLGASAASALVAAQTNITWRAELDLTCYTPGTAGTVQFFGMFYVGLTTGVLSAGSPIMVPASAPATTAIDTTTAQGLLLDATLGAAGDTMQTMFLAFESVN